jgi:hypothetical protein
VADLHHRLYTAVTGLSETPGAQYICLSARFDDATERAIEKFLMYLSPLNEDSAGYAVAFFPQQGLQGFARVDYSRFEADRGSRGGKVHIHMRLAATAEPGALLALGDLAVNFPINELIDSPAKDLREGYDDRIRLETLDEVPHLLPSLPKDREDLENVLAATLALHGTRRSRSVRGCPQWRNAAAAISTLPLSMRQDCRWGTGVKVGTTECVDFLLCDSDADGLREFADATQAAGEYAAYLSQPGRTEGEVLEIAGRQNISDPQDLSQFLCEHGGTVAKANTMPKTPPALTEPPANRVQLSKEVRQELQRQYDEMRKALQDELNERLAVLDQSVKTIAAPSPPEGPAKEAAAVASAPTWRWLQWMRANRNLAVILGAVLAMVVLSMLAVGGAMLLRQVLKRVVQQTSTDEQKKGKSGGKGTSPVVPPITSTETTRGVEGTGNAQGVAELKDANQRLQKMLQEAPSDRVLNLCEKIRDSHGLTKAATVTPLQKTTFEKIATKIKDRKKLDVNDVVAITRGGFEYIIAAYNPQSKIVIDLVPQEETANDLQQVTNRLGISGAPLEPGNADLQALIVEQFLNKKE